ncbi:MAG: hypothetical protein KF704_08365 [Crocinitomicaceae bacterium]|nr:hypothetical protein [Crocinitomicaceae bacterium]
MEVPFKSRKLRNSIRRVTDKAKNQDLDLNSLSVYGVTKENGVTVTGKGVGKNLGEYYYFSGQKIAYNPYRANIGSIGLTKSDFRGLMSPAYVIFEVDDTIYPEFLLLYLKSDIGQRLIKWYGDRGGIRSSLRISDLGKIDFPDINYQDQKSFYIEFLQKKIKVDELFKELSIQEKSLVKMQKNILDDAIQGKLTLKWRTTEYVSQITSKELENQKLSNKNRDIKERPIEAVPFEIPKSWTWLRFCDLYSKIEAGKSPKCYPYPAEFNEWGVIKISAISWGTFQAEENKKLPLNINPFIEKEIRGGDFILTRANTPELVGRSVIVEEDVRQKLLLNDKTLRIRLHEDISKEYINIANNSSYARRYYSHVATGTSDSMKNVSRQDIALMYFPIPPYEEQVEIVAKVTKLQEYCNQVAQSISHNKEYLEKLTNSLLIDLLGFSDNLLLPDNENKDYNLNFRKIKYDSKTTLMELIDLLKEHGKLHAEDLWKMSKHFDDKNIGDSIDKFYADLKKKIEVDKAIKEVENEKGYLELV